MFAFLAPWLLKLSTIGSTLGSIPTKVWTALTVAGYVIGIYALVIHELHIRDAGIRAQEDALWQAKLDAEVAKMSIKDEQIAQMANQLRKANDEENRRIAAGAADLRLHGPGKAVCPGLSAAPAAPSRPSTGRPSHDSLAPVPDAGGAELIALPFDDTALWGADHDYWRARALSWDAWYANLLKSWPHGK